MEKSHHEIHGQIMSNPMENPTENILKSNENIVFTSLNPWNPITLW